MAENQHCPDPRQESALQNTVYYLELNVCGKQCENEIVTYVTSLLAYWQVRRQQSQSDFGVVISHADLGSTALQTCKYLVAADHSAYVRSTESQFNNSTKGFPHRLQVRLTRRNKHKKDLGSESLSSKAFQYAR